MVSKPQGVDTKDRRSVMIEDQFIKVQYESARANFTTEIARAKRASWKQFMEESNPIKPFGASYKYMRDVVNYRLKFTGYKHSDGFMGSTTTYVDGTYKPLIDYHVTIDHIEDNNAWQRHVRRGVDSLGHKNKIFDEAEANRVIAIMKKNKVPVPDGLPIEFD